MTTLRDQLVKTLHEAEDGPTCTCAPGARRIYETQADALLTVLGVEEQHGLTWPGGSGGIDWFDTEAEAVDNLAFRTQRSLELGEQTKHVRRFVLTTKPEELSQP